MRSDLPADGGDVSSVGTRRERRVARERSEFTVVGVEIRDVVVSGGPGDRRSKIPCIFATRGLERH